MKPTFAMSIFALVLVAVTVSAVEIPRVHRAATADDAIPVDEPQTPDLPAAAKGPCPQTQKGGGFGGNSASCSFSCNKGDYLTVHVQSADTVYVWGDADCGGAHAHCNAKEECSGTSASKTTSDGTGSCSANSDEKWKSALSVDCKAAGGIGTCTPLGCQDAPNDVKKG